MKKIIFTYFPIIKYRFDIIKHVTESEYAREREREREIRNDQMTLFLKHILVQRAKTHPGTESEFARAREREREIRNDQMTLFLFTRQRVGTSSSV